MGSLGLLLVVNLFVGGLVFCSVREHLLSALLSLEYLVLSIFLLLICGLELVGGFYGLVYLIVVACEGALGLSILIIMSRSHGGDYLMGAGVLFF